MTVAIDALASEETVPTLALPIITRGEKNFIYNIQELSCKLMTLLGKLGEQSRSRAEVLKKEYGRDSEANAKLFERKGKGTVAFALGSQPLELLATHGDKLKQLLQTDSQYLSHLSTAAEVGSKLVGLGEHVFASNIDANQTRKRASTDLKNTEISDQNGKGSENRDLLSEINTLMQSLRQALQAASRF